MYQMLCCVESKKDFKLVVVTVAIELENDECEIEKVTIFCNLQSLFLGLGEYVNNIGQITEQLFSLACGIL